MEKKKRVCGLDFHAGDTAENSTFGQYSTTNYVDYIINYLDDKKSHRRPWFTMLALQSVHAPLQAPERFINMYRHVRDPLRRVHMAMVTAMDFELGRLFKRLDLQNVDTLGTQDYLRFF